MGYELPRILVFLCKRLIDSLVILKGSTTSSVVVSFDFWGLPCILHILIHFLSHFFNRVVFLANMLSKASTSPLSRLF